MMCTKPYHAENKIKALMLSLVFYVLCFLSHFTLIAQTNSGPKTPEELGQAVFNAFKNNDSIAYAKLIFTDADCEKMSKNADAPDSLKASVLKQMKTVARITRRGASKSFLSIYEKSQEKKFDWSGAELIRTEQLNAKTRNNIQSTDLMIFCKQDHLIFVIMLGQCHKSDAWLMMVPKAGGSFISQENMDELKK